MSRNFYLYEIRNLLDNKIYIGAHSTNNMDDGYMGSGSRNGCKKSWWMITWHQGGLVERVTF